jgi:mannan endo-1,4-beta-mannosidase
MGRLIGIAVFLAIFSGAVFAQHPSGFVYRSGRHFMVDGRPFYFAGNNTYYLAMVDRDRQESLIAENKNKGIRVIRCWAFSNGESWSMQPSVGEYNESALRGLDSALKLAGDYGIKLVLTLVNNWDDYNGMQWYVNQRGGGDKDDFYTRDAVRRDYKNWVDAVLNRTNTCTGVRYKNDPTIFSWELANEPRCRSDASGNTLYRWIDEMASYIKSIDSNHMVAIGDEGFKTGGISWDWTENGSEGIDFARNIACANIDYVTVHLYPEHWNKDLSWALSFLEDRRALARRAGKPIVLEEYGRSAAMGDRDTAYPRWHNLCTNSTNDYDGLMVWQMEDRDDQGDGFSFSFESETARIMSELAAVQNTKSSSR